MQPSSTPPLTADRIQALLDTLERTGGDPMHFTYLANMARWPRPGAAPPELPVPADKMVRLGDDLQRLELIWNTAGDAFLPGGGGAAAAFAAFDLLAGAWREGAAGDPLGQEDAGAPAGVNDGLREMAAMLRLTASMGLGMSNNAFATFTREEMAAVEAHAPRIAAALAPEASPTMMALQADSAARAASMERINDDDPEARAWLRTNGQDAPLAANRFDAAEALAFVDELYAAGAERVVIAAESIRDDEHELSQGGPYADTLKVRLPADPERRRALFAISDREAEEEGFDPEPDTGQEVLIFWWD